MRIKTLIIDDEPLVLDKLRGYVERVPFLKLAAQCQSAADAAEFLSREKVDLIFTDINMPDQTGMEFLDTLEEQPMVVFTTAHSEYAIAGYKYSAVDYLLKPYRFVDFLGAATKARELYDKRQNATAPVFVPESIFVKEESRFLRITLADITYIKGYGEYLQIFTRTRTAPVMTISSFAAIKSRLLPSFVQVHRSYIVNMDRVEHIERNGIFIDSQTRIPVSEGYRQNVQDYLAGCAVSRK